MTRFYAVELKGRSDMPEDWTFDGAEFRHLFNPMRDTALFDSEDEARLAIANAPRRPDTQIAIFKWRW